jgi:hypothetical protein
MFHFYFKNLIMLTHKQGGYLAALFIFSSIFVVTCPQKIDPA